MKQSNKDYLEQNIQHLINARADFFKHLSGEVRTNFERIMSEEFRPGYKADIFCDKCCLEMMKILFIHYTQWKDRQPKPEPVIEFEELTITAEPQTVAANFPSHKKQK